MANEQVIVVTGGASGIGRAIVEAALAEGWKVIAADRDQAALDTLRGELEANGGAERLRLEALDVTDEAAVIECLGRCDGEFGAITGLVNSAGTGADLPALKTGTAQFRQMLDVNLIGSFTVCREAALLMRRRGHGAMVNLASVSALVGNYGRTAYGATKGGLITMSKVMAVELAPDGIRVNVIAPGPIETPMVSYMHTARMRATWETVIPQRRYGTPAEVASAAIFLLDGGKSGYITGQVMAVDGGFSTAGIIADTSDD